MKLARLRATESTPIGSLINAKVTEGKSWVLECELAV
jgi:hypothetical protein